MKQNTKFLWIYICILFSFAVILIVFAGLSTNEEKGLENKVEKVSTENNNLIKENENLQNIIKTKDGEILSINQSLEEVKSQNTELSKAQAQSQSNEEILENAMTEYEKGNNSKCKEYLDQLDESTLTYSQKYMYNMMTK